MMASIIFSASYNTLGCEEYRYVVRAIEESNVRMSVILQAPELTYRKLDKQLFPRSIIARNRFAKFVCSMMDNRLQAPDPECRDIFSFFQHAKDPDTGKGLGMAELGAESATLIVAGKSTHS